MKQTFCSNIERPARYFFSSEEQFREILSSTDVDPDTTAAADTAADTATDTDTDSLHFTSERVTNSSGESNVVFIGRRPPPPSVVFNDDLGGILTHTPSKIIHPD